MIEAPQKIHGIAGVVAASRRRRTRPARRRRRRSSRRCPRRHDLAVGERGGLVVHVRGAAAGRTRPARQPRLPAVRRRNSARMRDCREPWCSSAFGLSSGAGDTRDRLRHPCHAPVPLPVVTRVNPAGEFRADSRGRGRRRGYAGAHAARFRRAPARDRPSRGVGLPPRAHAVVVRARVRARRRRGGARHRRHARRRARAAARERDLGHDGCRDAAPSSPRGARRARSTASRSRAGSPRTSPGRSSRRSARASASARCASPARASTTATPSSGCATCSGSSTRPPTSSAGSCGMVAEFKHASHFAALVAAARRAVRGRARRCGLGARRRPLVMEAFELDVLDGRDDAASEGPRVFLVEAPGRPSTSCSPWAAGRRATTTT